MQLKHTITAIEILGTATKTCQFQRCLDAHRESCTRISQLPLVCAEFAELGCQELHRTCILRAGALQNWHMPETGSGKCAIRSCTEKKHGNLKLHI